jgi:hypothetical protein
VVCSTTTNIAAPAAKGVVLFALWVHAVRARHVAQQRPCGSCLRMHTVTTQTDW